MPRGPGWEQFNKIMDAQFVTLGLLRAAIALAALLTPVTSLAQAPYPNQSIRFIVPYAAGGLPDTG